MKKLIVLLILVLAVAGTAFAQLRAGGTMYVAVRTVNLKSGTGWFARNTGTLEYGDMVTVISVSGRFAEVRSARNPSLTGWVNESSITPRQVVTGVTSTATAAEVSLAGKGFSQEIEDAYRSERDLEAVYHNLDEIERITVDFEALEVWLIEGRLSMGAQ